MKKPLILLITLLCTALLSAQDNRRTVAVVPAQGYGIPQNIRDGITEGLLEGVVNSGQFRAVARGADFQRALGEMDFQQGGAVADDQLIEFGRALRADFVSFAVISRFGEGLYRITFRMVDVASGEIPQGLAGSETVTTGALGVLQATDNIAQRLFGGARPQQAQQQQPARPAQQQESTPPAFSHCNNNTPGWGNSLGRVSFESNRTTRIGDRIWSDAVTATACQKTSFDGGSWSSDKQRGNNNWNADCRSNPGFPGDLFSWCAVQRFGNLLCPSPWRVPTRADFRRLHEDIRQHRDTYRINWRGAFGGFSWSGGALHSQGSSGYYWSQSEQRGGALGLVISEVTILPYSWIRFETSGKTLRCVRNR